jgi:hypothetical protein
MSAYEGETDVARTILRTNRVPKALVGTDRDAAGSSQKAVCTDPDPRPPLFDVVRKCTPNQADSGARRLMHNHPSGDPTPSRADIEVTQAIVAVGRPLGIAVHDHIIVGKDGHASLKGMRLI